MKVRILSIETSCDETSVAILAASKTGIRLTHHETATQIPIHQRYGGVVPEVAARTHVAEVVSLLERAGAFSKRPPFDAIAVTRGPGLATALRVGIDAARTIAAVTDVPVIGVNHLEGHLASVWLVPENRKHWKFPLLTLLVSGGHTEIVLMKDFGKYQVLGRTRDDAAGEAFDKTAKLMGLGYPGGPMIAQLAVDGDPRAISFPRPMLNDGSSDFSFSGLKSAVRREWESQTMDSRLRGNDKTKVIADFCASIQQAITDVLVAKMLAAAQKVKPAMVSIAGGVSANVHLQQQLAQAFAEKFPSVRMLQPAKGLHTDNAAMIAAAGYWQLRNGKKSNWKTLDSQPELDL
jgi:N6-L-threonylcarbamoyladenine synthase